MHVCVFFWRRMTNGVNNANPKGTWETKMQIVKTWSPGSQWQFWLNAPIRAVRDTFPSSLCLVVRAGIFFPFRILENISVCSDLVAVRQDRMADEWKRHRDISVRQRSVRILGPYCIFVFAGCCAGSFKNASGCPTCFIVFTFCALYPFRAATPLPLLASRVSEADRSVCLSYRLVSRGRKEETIYLNSPRASAKNRIVSLDVIVDSLLPFTLSSAQPCC